MAYSNNYSQNRGYSFGNYNAGNNRPRKKRSGAKVSKYYPESGVNKGVEQYIVNAWRVTNKQLIKITAVTTYKSKLSDKGWIGSVAVTFVNTKTGQKTFHWGTMQKSTGKVIISETSMVLNPKARNGGYAGTFIRGNASSYNNY